MTTIVVSDTTALVHLSRIGALHLLQRIYTNIVIPEAVYDEVVRKGASQPGAAQVMRANWISTVKVKNKTVVDKLTRGLDLGEAEAIALSLELKAAVLIIDEVKGRATASAFGLHIIGMGGILLRAKQENIIPEVKSYLDALERTGFRLGAATRAIILQRAGESALPLTSQSEKK